MSLMPNSEEMAKYRAEQVKQANAPHDRGAAGISRLINQAYAPAYHAPVFGYGTPNRDDGFFGVTMSPQPTAANQNFALPTSRVGPGGYGQPTPRTPMPGQPSMSGQGAMGKGGFGSPGGKGGWSRVPSGTQNSNPTSNGRSWSDTYGK